MRKFLLDPSKENVHLCEYNIVDDEISLLRGFLQTDSLLIRGERLSEWASIIAESRLIETIWLDSPSVELNNALPLLSMDKSRVFFKAHSDLFATLNRPINPVDIAKKLWPESDLWGRDPDGHHALSWLLFIIDTDFTEIECDFIDALSASFIDISPSDLKLVYSSKKNTAWDLILEWTKSITTNHAWPKLPEIELSENIYKKLKEVWRCKLINTGGLYFEDYISREPDITLIRKVAREAVDFYHSNPTKLNRKGFDILEKFLKIKDRDALTMIFSPEDPGFPPDEYEKLVHWFKHSYLPFRTNSQFSDDLETRDRIKEIAMSFSSWFLDYYVSARVGGNGSKFFSWSRAANLGNSKTEVTLLVVLDGLSYRDAEFIQKQITELTSRLSVEVFDVAISPLPTVTEFAKKALFSGLPPAKAFEINQQIGLRERNAPAVISSLDSASHGDIIIWSWVEPDNIYHKKLDALSICQEVEGWLQGFSKRIVDVAHKVKHSQNLKVIITTDHGRLMSSSARTHVVPSGMEAHGRAAWGSIHKDFGKNGYIVEGDIAYLHPQRFGIPEVCAISLNGDSFMMSDGRGGQESFPHGGIYPEEVLIPWLCLSRDQEEVSLVVSLVGSGVAGLSGIYKLEIINPGSARIHVIEIVLSLGKEKIPIDLEIGALSQKKVEIKTKSWPKNIDADRLTATLIYELLSGERRTMMVQPVIDIEEMYQQNDILSDW